MKKFVCLLLALALVVPFTAFASIEMETFYIGNFIYQAPKGWIATEIQDNGFRNHYAKMVNSAEDGYLAARVTSFDFTPTEDISLNEIYVNLIERIIGLDNHVSEIYSKKIEINGIDARMFSHRANVSGTVSTIVTILALVGSDLFTIAFINDEYDDKQVEEFMMELSKSVWYLQVYNSAILTEGKAISSVLRVNWSNATLYDLQTAQLQLAERITQIQAASYDDTEAIVLTGSGTDILSSIEVNFSPSRVRLEGNSEAKLTGGSYDFYINASEGYAERMMAERGSLTALIEAKGNWTLTIEPIKLGGNLPMSGIGPFVSDFFPLAAPMIVTLKADTKNMEAWLTNVIIALKHQYKNIDSWQSNTLSNELLSSNKQFEADVIIQPVAGRDQYFFEVDVSPGVEWSITLKK